MHKIRLSVEQVEEVVREGKYSIDPNTVVLDDTSFLATSADEQKIFEVAAEQYGFLVDKTKLAKILDTMLPAAAPTMGREFGGAVLLIEGDFSVRPDFTIAVGNNEAGGRMYTYHRTVLDRRHRLLAQWLTEKGGVELMGDTDAEYLYQILSLVQEEHLFETLKRLVAGLPIYRVVFGPGGSFSIDEEGTV